ncbi:MAG TPA: RHS repeat-associated core domain-containing protein [Clostridia bacterium]|nr:RHS repeat-associated core domain-containing protein [Clostridia bacterium]
MYDLPILHVSENCVSKVRKFTGKERDTETGLDYFGARYYASNMGRFSSPDEPFIDQDQSDPQSWNLYTYVRNNPLSNTNPTGNACVNGKDDDRGGETCAQVAAADAEYQKQHRASATVTANDGTQEGRIFELSYAISDLTRPHSLLDVIANAGPYAVGGYGLARSALAAPAITTLNVGRYVTGQVIERVIQTPQGPLVIKGTIEIVGDTIKLKNLSVVSPGGVEVLTNPGPGALKTVFDGLKSDFAQAGFSTAGYRFENYWCECSTAHQQNDKPQIAPSSQRSRIQLWFPVSNLGSRRSPFLKATLKNYS